MKKILLLLALATLAGAAHGGVVYSQLSTTGLTVNTGLSPDALDDVNFATGSTSVRQELSAMTFGYGELAGTAAQTGGVIVEFYNTLNPTSTGAVESNFIGGFEGNFNIAANTGTGITANGIGFTGLNTLPSPIYFTGNNIGVEIFYTNATFTNYSSVVTPLMSVPGVPTVGSSTTGLYRDSNGDGDFEANEFDPTEGNLYLSITTVASPTPEPSALVALGLGALAVLRRRKRA